VHGSTVAPDTKDEQTDSPRPEQCCIAPDSL
jgi:hypothetical protein